MLFSCISFSSLVPALKIQLICQLQNLISAPSAQFYCLDMIGPLTSCIVIRRIPQEESSGKCGAYFIFLLSGIKLLCDLFSSGGWNSCLVHFVIFMAGFSMRAGSVSVIQSWRVVEITVMAYYNVKCYQNPICLFIYL